MLQVGGRTQEIIYHSTCNSRGMWMEFGFDGHRTRKQHMGGAESRNATLYVTPTLLLPPRTSINITRASRMHCMTWMHARGSERGKDTALILGPRVVNVFTLGTVDLDRAGARNVGLPHGQAGLTRAEHSWAAPKVHVLELVQLAEAQGRRRRQRLTMLPRSFYSGSDMHGTTL